MKFIRLVSIATLFFGLNASALETAAQISCGHGAEADGDVRIWVNPFGLSKDARVVYQDAVSSPMACLGSIDGQGSDIDCVGLYSLLHEVVFLKVRREKGQIVAHWNKSRAWTYGSNQMITVCSLNMNSQKSSVDPIPEQSDAVTR